MYIFWGENSIVRCLHSHVSEEGKSITFHMMVTHDIFRLIETVCILTADDK